jgi:CubicO group peptidase (beta-lactamase class C family)
MAQMAEHDPKGTVDPAFAGVAEVLGRQLRRSTGGGSVAVWHRGECVVDIWGGWREPDEVPWQSDTLAMCFSTTKGVAATAVHVIADRGEIDYDEPVATYWPEFAQNGKDGVTVRHVLSHSAGLHRLRSIIDNAERMLDWDHMAEALAAAPLAYEPGTSAGYHALTYGWLTGEIVRRVSGRPIDQFVQDEIAGPLDLDGLYLGCPESERYRIAPLAAMGVPRIPNRFVYQAQKKVGEQFGKLASAVHFPVNPRRIINALVPRGIEDVLFGEGIMDTPIPAANGFFTARSLGKMYALWAGGGAVDGVRLLGRETVAEAGRVHHSGLDRVLVLPMGWRLGFHSASGFLDRKSSAFGHFGFGGSGGWADPERGLALAFVCNRGAGSPIGDLRILHLTNAAVECAKRLDAAETRALAA